jgi:hypothetical protein
MHWKAKNDQFVSFALLCQWDVLAREFVPKKIDWW